jgi:hypothetical protein
LSALDKAKGFAKKCGNKQITATEGSNLNCVTVGLKPNKFVKHHSGKRTSAGQAKRRQSIAIGRGYLNHARECKLDEQIMAALFDEGEHFSGKSLPLSSDIRDKGRIFEQREMFLNEGVIFGNMTTRFGKSDIPLNALVVGKSRKVNLGHDIES